MRRDNCGGIYAGYRMKRVWISVVTILSVLLLGSLSVNAKMLLDNQSQSNQIQYAESYGMDHVVANIDLANALINKDKGYSATQIAEAAGDLVTLSKIIPPSRSNASNYAWNLGYYLHSHAKDFIGTTNASATVVQFIKKADTTLSTHTKNGHYDASYLFEDIIYLGENVPKS